MILLIFDVKIKSWQCLILWVFPGNILFVAHASSLDTCSRQLVGKQPKNEVDMMKLVTKVPYTAVAVVELSSGPQWKIVEPPFPPLMHLNNAGFQWRTLLDWLVWILNFNPCYRISDFSCIRLVIFCFNGHVCFI